MGFNVFIERARDPSPAALERTAQALAARYGFPPTVILDRLRSGRFEAWNNLDHATARRCAGELEAFGIVCSVSEDGGTPPPLPSPPTAPPARTLAGAPPIVPPRPPASGYASGLAAAYSGPADQELGALAGGAADGGWQIESLDGTSDEQPTAVSGAPVTFRPPGTPPPMPGKPPPPAPVLEDRFAPPDAAREAVLELDVASPAAAPPVTARATGAVAAIAAPTPSPASNAPRAGAAVNLPQAPPADAPMVARAIEQLAEGRANLAVGVLLALLIAFIPASIVTSARERSYDEVRAELGRTFAAVDGPAAWDDASDARVAALAKVEQRRRGIAVTGLVVWALGFAGLAYLWFRVIDWDALRRRRVPVPASSRRAAAR